MRYPRGSIVRVDFGVNVGSEFSNQHFAITLSKKDGIYNNTIIVIPLTSKEHKNYINLGKLISDGYLTNLQNEIDKIQERINKTDIKILESNSKILSELREIRKILKYYKSIKDNFSYACINQIRTVSKLNIIPPINKYDIIGNYKCPKDVMCTIDKNIVKTYTALDYREFEKIFSNYN